MSTLTAAGTSVGTTHPELSLTRLNLMRGGYLFMGLGLALVKWPLLPDASTMPLYEGVTLTMLVAMSLGALLGLRHPVTMLPVLLFESAWKLLWLGLVALPQAVGDGLDSATSEMLVKNSLVVVILAVVPWRYVWQRYVRTTGDRWIR
jgi:hypothetical protein